MMQEEGTAVEARLVRVETKLDMLIESLTPRHNDVDARLRAAELLISEIKTKVALVSGGAGALAGIATALVAHFVGA